MLITILDPLDRSSKPQRRRAGQNILRVKFAADPETATDMPLVQVNAVERQPEHRGERLPVVMRHLGSAVQPKNAARRLRHGDRTAGFERHAAVPADDQLERHYRMRSSKSSFQIA